MLIAIEYPIAAGSVADEGCYSLWAQPLNVAVVVRPVRIVVDVDWWPASAQDDFAAAAVVDSATDACSVVAAAGHLS